MKINHKSLCINVEVTIGPLLKRLNYYLLNLPRVINLMGPKRMQRIRRLAAQFLFKMPKLWLFNEFAALHTMQGVVYVTPQNSYATETLRLSLWSSICKVANISCASVKCMLYKYNNTRAGATAKFLCKCTCGIDSHSSGSISMAKRYDITYY